VSPPKLHAPDLPQVGQREEAKAVARPSGDEQVAAGAEFQRVCPGVGQRRDVAGWTAVTSEEKDPTGAGDSFAGGFIGWIAKTDDLSEENFKRAVIYGSALASFCVERFSLDRLKDLSYPEIQDRFREFRELSKFEAGADN